MGRGSDLGADVRPVHRSGDRRQRHERWRAGARATLEPLLLTPSGNRQLVLGKFLAAMSPWPAAMAVTLPYMAALSQGHQVLGEAVLSGALSGTLLAGAFVALAVIVEHLVELEPAQPLRLPPRLRGCLIPGPAARRVPCLARRRPDHASRPRRGLDQLLSKVLAGGAAVAGVALPRIEPAIALALALGALFGYAAPACG